MFKFIVTWMVVTIVPDSCPDAGKVDQFGRVVNRGYSCAVFHAKTVFNPQKKEFGNRDSAFAFYRDALKHQPDSNSIITMWSDNNLADVKIDSVKIK